MEQHKRRGGKLTKISAFVKGLRETKDYWADENNETVPGIWDIQKSEWKKQNTSENMRDEKGTLRKEKERRVRTSLTINRSRSPQAIFLTMYFLLLEEMESSFRKNEFV